MTTYYVYRHISPNNKIYVGLTHTKPERRWQHGNGYKKNEMFYSDICKYGWGSFEHQILLETTNEQEAVELEERLIKELDLLNPDKGYNLRHGDNGGFSKQSLERMGESRTGNTNCVGRVLSTDTKDRIAESLRKFYSDHPNPFAGKKHSDDTRKRLSEITKANPPSARKVNQLTIDGDLVATYDRISDAATACGIDASSISKVCRGKKKTSGGFRWEYADSKS